MTTTGQKSWPVRYGDSQGTVRLLPDNDLGGAWFMHDKDPGFGPMAYAVSAASCVYRGACGGEATFEFHRETVPGYGLKCSCGWNHNPAWWPELRAALNAHLAGEP